ncbi:MAG TPA: ligase-associated DNA damage response DEXH box helicase, partial [Phycisphaerae bacterium]|nr:ligase-associated DNA damage response DEXH box helicase [Phycisphaerae bacterium]
MKPIEEWFHARGWAPFDYQRRAWDAYLAGGSGLVNAPTGVGKTYSIWMGPLLEYLAETGQEQHIDPIVGPREPERIRVLWLTPLRALANDTLESLRAPVNELGLPWSGELRTGDTSSSVRLRQKKRFPTVLVTTPESLSLQLTYEETREKLRTLRCVVVDEWHELLGTKRGVQTELCLARLARWLPDLRVWGLSATIGNLEEACDVLVSPVGTNRGTIIRGPFQKKIEIESLIPEDIERFPWAGHLGIKLLGAVIQKLENARSTLCFTNTRSQAEIWFRDIQRARLDWIGQIAIHHGSIDRNQRVRTEQMIRDGQLRCVVCTSSLDLGVDFSPVDQVIQIGSPKGVARLMQRAGRSGHQPGGVSRVVCVPTHAFELIEVAAVRRAMREGQIEARTPLRKALDVLVQHIVTIACGGGFDDRELLDEVRRTHAYRDLTDEEWGWTLDFVERGGSALTAYPDYARVVRQDGIHVVASQKIARRHRMSIGTISSDTTMTVRLVSGRVLGTIEESFIARLSPGDHFIFSGRTLELVRVRDMSAQVRVATRSRGAVPRWQGGRFPLTTQLGNAVRHSIAESLSTNVRPPEMQAVLPLMELQQKWSLIPRADEILVESTRMREGFLWYVFPFEGRLVHEGLAALLAYRLTRAQPLTVGVTATDYGCELRCAVDLALDERRWREILSIDLLADDLLACSNMTELARRQFRDIARIAGLVF